MTRFTVLPSPTSMLAHDTGTSPGDPIPPLVFEFDQPVSKVGAFTEAAIGGGFDGQVTLEAFDTQGVSLGAVDIIANGIGGFDGVGNFDSWIGLETLSGEPLIDSVQFSGHFMAIDDLWFEPAPGPSCLVGDVNLDGLRDGLDVAPFASAMLTNPLPASPEFCAADMDGDGALLLAFDLPLFVDCLVDGTCP